MKVVGTTGKVSTLEIHNNKTLELELSGKGASYVDVKDDARECDSKRYSTRGPNRKT